jgi:hypothetical protein
MKPLRGKAYLRFIKLCAKVAGKWSKLVRGEKV